MTPFAHFTTDTGTHELPSLHRGRPLAELPTTELPFPWFMPSPPVRYERPNRARRLLNSPAAHHLRSATRAAFWPTAIGAGVVLALVVLAYLHTLAPVSGVR